jgi:hypothetical protein
MLLLLQLIFNLLLRRLWQNALVGRRGLTLLDEAELLLLYLRGSHLQR